MQGGFGGMLSIRARGGEAAAIAVAATTQLWKRATSLGGTESLIEHRASVEGAGTPAPADLLADACGWIFPVGDVSAMRKLMEHACRSPAALAAVAASAQRRVAAYDTSVLVGLHERLYRSVLEAVDASA
jgi:hypothetical protein